MKILKYTFEIPQLIVEDGELLEMGTKEETYIFTLLFKGIDLYEKLTGKPLLTDLTKMSQMGNVVDVELIKNLAKCSYCKIEGDSFHQNMVTADEFSKTQAFSRIGMDTDFMSAIVQMAVDCCISNTQKASDGAKAKK